MSRPTVRRILTKAASAVHSQPPLQQHRFRRRRMPQEGINAGADRRQQPSMAGGPGTEAGAAHSRGRRHGAPWLRPSSAPARTPAATWCSLRRPASVSGESPWPSTATATLLSSTTPVKSQVPVETTQFARVMRDLGIQQIFALSPQAKGRVERMLETFQDRLVTELRLAGASTIDQAKEVLQEFLPKFNTRFAVGGGAPRDGLPAGAGRAFSGRDHLHQRHPEGGPGQHGEVPLAGAAVAARGGARPSYAGLGWRYWNGPTGSC